jgi:hypothetical protein
LTDYAPLKKRECLDSDICLHLVTARQAGEALAEAVRKYHLPDFSNWQPLAAFARAFAPPALHFGATGRLENFLRSTL